MSSFKNVPNELRVCHFAQVPCKPFIQEVKNEQEAFLLVNTLAKQHLFLLQENIIPDYSNVIIVEMFEDDEWVNYWNESVAMEWEEIVNEYKTELSDTAVVNYIDRQVISELLHLASDTFNNHGCNDLPNDIISIVKGSREYEEQLCNEIRTWNGDMECTWPERIEGVGDSTLMSFFKDKLLNQ